MSSSDRRTQMLAGIAATNDDRRNRVQFLLAMYKATWDNINRHILVVWQSIAALFAALAASYLSSKELVSPDLGTSLIVLAAGWSIANALDSSDWYNRNLLIIGNIERQFLFDDDVREIHGFFPKHRGAHPIAHLAIQIVLAMAIAGLALLHHFSTRVASGFGAPWCQFDPWRAVPYFICLVAAITLLRFHLDARKTYACLVAQSPGRDR